HGVERREDSGRLPERDHCPVFSKTRERIDKRRIADAVVNNVNADSACDVVAPCHETFGSDVDDVRAAIAFRALGFDIATHRSDDDGTEMLCPSCHDRTDATGGTMKQHGVPRLDAKA